jgi:hypothetical protein
MAALGVDVASIDYGASTDFIVHHIAAAAGVLGLENLTNLSALPPSGATIIALPMKIENGSGGPLRAVALVPRQAPFAVGASLSWFFQGVLVRCGSGFATPFPSRSLTLAGQVSSEQ